MKVIKFFSTLGGIILFYGFIGTIALLLVVFTDKTENRYGERCNTADAYDLSEIFLEDEVVDINHRLQCNTYYVNVTLNEDVTSNQVKALMIKYSIKKDELNITTPIEVLVTTSKSYFSRLLDDGTITFVG